METVDFHSKSTIRSQRSVIFKALFEHLIALSVSGAFLAKLLATLDISDSLNGIISSVGSVAFIFQVFSFFLANRKINAKRITIVSQTLSILLFTFLYVIPFLPMSQKAKAVLFVIVMIIAQITKTMFSPLWFKLWTTLVAPQQRGSFYASVTSVSLIFGNIIYVTALGYIVDVFESTKNINGAFLFVIIVSSVFNLCHFICTMNVQNCDISSDTKEKLPVSDVIRNTLFNKGYMAIVAMNGAHNFASSFTVGFISVYCIKELNMSMLTIQIFGMISTFVGIFLAKPFGKFADKAGYIKSITWGYTSLLIAYIIIAFTVPSLWYLILIYNVITSIASAALGNNAQSILYQYVHKDYISQALTIKNIIAGLISFGSAILGGLLLDFVQNSGNTFMGFTVYGQQVLATISGLVMLIAICIAHFGVGKQKIKYE